MHLTTPLLTLFITSTLAAGPCDADSDACRAVINASACFNEFMSGGNKNSILDCLAGTDGAGTPTQKMCACTGCVAPVMTAWITKNKVC